MALYGGIPFVTSHTPNLTGGALWLNAAETWVDVKYRDPEASIRSWFRSDQPSADTFWLSETGKIDLFLMAGPSIQKVNDQYTTLTGRPQMPPQWATAYHQCKWNYRDMEDVAQARDHFLVIFWDTLVLEWKWFNYCDLVWSQWELWRSWHSLWLHLARYWTYRGQTLFHMGPEQVRKAARNDRWCFSKGQENGHGKYSIEDIKIIRDPRLSIHTSKLTTIIKSTLVQKKPEFLSRSLMAMISMAGAGPETRRILILQAHRHESGGLSSSSLKITLARMQTSTLGMIWMNHQFLMDPKFQCTGIWSITGKLQQDFLSGSKIHTKKNFFCKTYT